MFVSGVGSMPNSSISVTKTWFTRTTRLALVACAASGMAACSGSIQRFADYPPVNTNSVSPSAAAASSESVQARPLDQGPLAPARPTWQGYSAPTAPSQQRPVWKGYSAAAPAAAVTRDPAPLQGGDQGWSGQVTVRRGQTLYS